MPHPEKPFLFSVGNSSAFPDPYVRGLEYLRTVQRLALDPSMINVFDQSDDVSTSLQAQQRRVLTWIGHHIDMVNAELYACLNVCHDCFHPEARQPIQILAAPFTQACGVSGVCNILTAPITILVDVGRVIPQDWLALVAHEYAHAHISRPGHDQNFLSVLTHLCRGLGFASPPQSTNSETLARDWPPCVATLDPVAFWQGNHPLVRLNLSRYYSQWE